MRSRSSIHQTPVEAVGGSLALEISARSMARKGLLAAVLAGFGLWVGLGSLSSAQEVATDPVGFVKVTVPAKSDGALSMPFTRPAVLKGMIQSVSGNQITIAGTPNLSTNQFVAGGGQFDTFAVIIASGSKEGMTLKITANSTDSVTVLLEGGESLSDIATIAVNGASSGDLFDIVPYWTPKTLFKNPPAIGSLIFGYEGGSAGTNLSAKQIYAFDGSSWLDEFTTANADNVPLEFKTSFVFRNEATSSYTVWFTGGVPMVIHRSKLMTKAANVDQDIRIGFSSPVPESLRDLNIPAQEGDLILGFNINSSGINKSASQLFAYDGQQWINEFTGLPINGSVVLEPGHGYVYRKARTSTPETTVWSSAQTYLAP